MKDRITLIAYLLGWWIVRTLPEKTAYSLFYSIGEFTHRRNGKSIQRLRKNLHQVKPQLDEIELETLVAKSMSSIYALLVRHLPYSKVEHRENSQDCHNDK